MAKVAKIEGLDKALRKIKTGDFWEKPVKDFFDRAGFTVIDEAKRFSAVDSGRMRQSLSKGATDNIWEPMKQGLKIGTNVTDHGVSYPAILNDSGKYHYAAGPRAGSQTKGWFTDAPKRAGALLGKAVETLKREIAERWPR